MRKKLLTVGLFVAVITVLVMSPTFAFTSVTAAPTPVPGATPVRPTEVPCDPATGCVKMESGTTQRWWADEVKEGNCADQSDKDWLVTYKTDNSSWKKARSSQIRIYSNDKTVRSLVSKAQIDDSTPPGITICFGKRLTKDQVKTIWVWIKK